MNRVGFKIDGLTHGDKVRLIYLMHYPGSGDAKGFINNAIGNGRARVMLDAQVDGEVGAVCGRQSRQPRQRHRAWLNTFVDNHIRLSEKLCDPSKAMAVRTLLDVTVTVR